MDFTSTQVTVPNTNPEKDDLPASPVLLVATVDGILRFYTFSHTEKASSRLVQPPRPVTDVAPELLAPGVAAAGHTTAQLGQAAATGLPEGSEDDLQDEPETPPGSAHPPALPTQEARTAAQEAAPAASALPSVDEPADPESAASPPTQAAGHSLAQAMSASDGKINYRH